MDVSVVIPARDAATTLGATLAALRAQDFAGSFEVVVVDDGSSDSTIAVASDGGARVVGAGGVGPAAARNVGASVSSGEVLAFTDADCVPAVGWLSAVWGAIEGGGDLVSGRVRPPAGVDIGPFDRVLAVPGPSGLFETANLAVRRSVFESVGGFESVAVPSSGIELGEDVWLGWRAVRTGARAVFCPDALVEHVVWPRSVDGYVAERWRLRYFPALVRLVPELRSSFAFARVFHSRRSAAFDLAVLGVVFGTRRRVALAAVAPYAVLARRSSKGWGHPGRVLAGQVAADAVSSAALVWGSVRARSPLF